MHLPPNVWRKGDETLEWPANDRQYTFFGPQPLICGQKRTAGNFTLHAGLIFYGIIQFRLIKPTKLSGLTTPNNNKIKYAPELMARRLSVGKE